MGSTSLLYKVKSCIHIWGWVNQPHLYITSAVKHYCEVQFSSYRPQTECCISQFCNTNCTHSLFRIDRSTPGLLAKPLKNFQNHIYGQPVLTFAVRAVASVWTNILELSSNIIENLLCLFFTYLFYLCVIFKSVWYARHFEHSCKRCLLNEWKQTATINKRNIIRRNIYRENIFHSRRH